MTEKGAGKQVRNYKTRCYYTDYVNHAVRFYLSTPDTLRMEGKRKADIDNWLSVQDVWRKLNDDDRKLLETVYKLHYHLAEGVRMYCDKTGADSKPIWFLITRVSAQIARKRGLI